MLSKLIKYEFQSIMRIVAPVCIVFMAMSGLTFIVYSFSMNDNILRIIPGIVSFLYIIAIILLMASAFLFTIYRFYKNLITNEGYLMFTLPVKVDKLIQSKLVTAIATQVIAIVLCIFSIFIVGQAKYSPFALTGLSKEIENIGTMLGVSTPILYIIIIVLMLLTLFLNNQTFYASIAIGHTLAKNKFIGSVIGYLCIYVVGQVISSIITLIVYFLSDGDVSPYIMLAILFSALVGCSSILYYLTNKYLTNKLNLE
jgi:hypothetical protein